MDFEVEIKLNGVIEVAGVKLLGFDLIYAGLFRVQDVTEESLQPILMIDCPRLMFP